MSREFSAIDAIYMLHDKLDEQKKLIELMSQNIKELNNKVYILNNRVAKFQEERKEQVTQKSESKNITQKGAALPEQSSQLILGRVKVYGYIVNGSKQPVVGVKVDLFKNNKIIRNISTDKDGYWEARLPGGSYTVKYSHKKFKEVSRDISFQNDIKQYEVK